MPKNDSSQASEFIETLGNESNRLHVKCPFARILQNKDEEFVTALNKALDSDLYTSASIHRTLNSMGIKVGRDAVRHHRSKVCGCVDRG